MKITVGQLKKAIHSQLAEAKTAKQGEVKKINEGKKRYYIQDNIGKAKYTVNFHNGTSTHDDGSDFFDIRILHNKRERDAFVKQLNASGYHERGVMEDGFKPKGEVKKINEAVKMNIEQPYSNLYIKGWGMDANGNKTIIVGFPNDRGFPIQTNGTLPNTHNIISKAHKELSSDELAAVGKEITAYVSAHGSANQKSRLRTRSGTNESRKPSRNNVADYNQHHIAVDTVKNPNKSMLGGPSAEESEEILRNKFGYTDQEINMLKGVNESKISGEVKKINEATFTKLVKKLIVEESNDIKGIKLNESITEANTGSESIADKLFRQCMMYPDIIDPIQRIEIFGIIAKKLQDHALLLSKKYARDAKI